MCNWKDHGSAGEVSGEWKKFRFGGRSFGSETKFWLVARSFEREERIFCEDHGRRLITETKFSRGGMAPRGQRIGEPEDLDGSKMGSENRLERHLAAITLADLSITAQLRERAGDRRSEQLHRNEADVPSPWIRVAVEPSRSEQLRERAIQKELFAIGAEVSRRWDNLFIYWEETQPSRNVANEEFAELQLLSMAALNSRWAQVEEAWKEVEARRSGWIEVEVRLSAGNRAEFRSSVTHLEQRGGAHHGGAGTSAEAGRAADD